MRGNEAKFEFEASSEDDALSWIEAIQMHITESNGHKESIVAPSLEEFWKMDQISENELLRTADTFDILLFSRKEKSKMGRGKIFKSMTSESSAGE